MADFQCSLTVCSGFKKESSQVFGILQRFGIVFCGTQYSSYEPGCLPFRVPPSLHNRLRDSRSLHIPIKLALDEVFCFFFLVRLEFGPVVLGFRYIQCDADVNFCIRHIGGLQILSDLHVLDVEVYRLGVTAFANSRPGYCLEGGFQFVRDRPCFQKVVTVNIAFFCNDSKAFLVVRAGVSSK